MVEFHLTELSRLNKCIEYKSTASSSFGCENTFDPIIMAKCKRRILNAADYISVYLNVLKKITVGYA